MRSTRSATTSPEEERVLHEVIGGALAVHRAIGPGFSENLYARAMHAELRVRNLPFEVQRPVQVRYRDELLGTYRIDLIAAKLVVVELKAVERLDPVHVKQVVAYLKAAKLHLGAVINFNCELLKDGIRHVVG